MILCQKCGATNSLGQETCNQCGTKLMIVSSTHRHSGTLPVLEEHLLERISALEYALARLDERLNGIHELMQQLSTESFYDHTMIESIAEALKKLQIVGKRDLERDWHHRVTQRLLESEEREKFESSRQSFLNAFRGNNKERFSKLIEESSQFFINRNYRRGLRALEKAYSSDPQNCEIGIFLSKIYYESQNFLSAGRCLRRVLKKSPRHFEANFLTGLVAKREGNLLRAKQYLSAAVDICQTSLAARIFLGSVLVALGEDSGALGHFSHALSLQPSSQMHLLVGSIYSRQGKVRHAIKHMKKAIEIDPSCDQAFFQLGLAFLGQNWKKRARECFQAALKLNPKESLYRNALETFLKNHMKLNSGIDLELGLLSNEEGMEILVKDELHLNFRHSEPGSKSREDLGGK
jgi:tetratricopeptide (TPR) repeat protein